MTSGIAIDGIETKAASTRRLAKTVRRPATKGGLTFKARLLGLGSSLPVLAATMIFVAPASAQTAAADQSTASKDSGAIAEIVVTAEKRKQDERRIPTSILAISGAALDATHTTSIEDLTRQAPGVSIGEGGSEGSSNIEIRGVASSVGSATVGAYLDDVSITEPGGGTTGFGGQITPIPFDLARVEVLRGPQGTLYGASSMGGAIRFITNQPNLTRFSAEVTSDLSGTDFGGLNYEEKAVVNLPLIEDHLALRIGVDYAKDSGWINHYSQDGALLAKGTNSDWHGVFKVSALYENDGWSVAPSLWVQRWDSKDDNLFYPALGLNNQAKYLREPSDDRLIVPTLTVSKDVGFATITSVTAYDYRDQSSTIDGTYFNDAAFAYYFLDFNPAFASHQAQNDSIIAGVPSPTYLATRFSQVTEELRIASNPPGPGGLPLSYTFGAYYSDQINRSGNEEYSPGLNSAFQSIYGYSLSSPIVQSALGTTASTFANDFIYGQSITQRITEYALFGQVGYDILPRLHASVGLRYEYATQNDVALAAGFYGLGTPTPFSSHSLAHAPTPKFSLTYDIDKDSTVYGAISKGFRLGGATGDNPPSLCASDYTRLGITSPPDSYKPDSLWSYEAGVKSRLAERTLSVDADVYYIDWSNIQEQISLPTCGFGLIENVGNAKSYGAEMQIAYKPPFIHGLTVGLNAGINKSTLTSSVADSPATVGQSVLFAPAWSLSTNVEYRRELAEGAIGFIRADYEFTGHSHGSFETADPNYLNPAYGVMNGSLGLEMGSIKASLYAKNLLNDRTILQRPSDAEVTEGYTVRPLTVGITISKKFQ